jgi:4-hydroxy-tetrahydrodipicolinate synthase
VSEVEPLFRGVAVALVTLFDADLAVDVRATAEHAARLVALGITGVLVAGTTGEAAALDDDERDQLVRAIRQAIPEGVPVIAGTGNAGWSGQAAARARAAADAGADAVLVLSPPMADDPRPFYDEVAKATTGRIPLLAYHYPAASGPGIKVEYLDDLPIAAVKDSSGDAERLLVEVATTKTAVYPGSSALVALAGVLGCPGAILALANAEPEGCVAAFTDGAAQTRIAAAHLAQRTHGGFPHGIKALTAARFGTPTHARMG